MRIDTPLAVAVCLLLTGAAPPEPRKDAQAAYEPRSGPGVGQKFLEAFAGDWAVARTFYPRDGEPVRTEASCRQAMIHGGRFLQSDFVFGRGDTATTGQGVLGFEPDSGTFTSVWTDSRQTRMSFRQSREPFDGARVILYSSSLGEGGNEERRSKTVSRLEDEGRRLIHRQYALGPDGSERLMMELVMTRKGAPSSGGR